MTIEFASAPKTSRLAPMISRLSPYSLVGVFVAVIVIFSVLVPDTFLTTATLGVILSSQAPLLIATLALTLTLIVNEFDLTVGVILVFTDVFVAALAVNYHFPLALAAATAIVAGTAIGGINALLVVRLGINSFVATLGMATLMTGVTLAVGGSTIIADIPDPLVRVAGSEILGLPLVAYYAIAIAIVLWYLYERTPLGRYLYFTGADVETARLLGIPTKRIKTLAFVVSAFLISFAGFMEAGTVGSADPTAGPTFLLPAFAAAFLGATAIKVGRFNVWGTLIASYLLFTGVTGLALLGLTGWVQDAFNGVALLAAIVTSQLTSSRS